MASLVASGRLHAEPTAGDKALADSLFQEGKRLMASKRYADACPKLAESQRLDPATGTLLNLAVCHEAEGKIATAWVEFGDALVDARKEKRAERVKLAQDHIAKLEPRLPKLKVAVPPEARAPGLSVTRNGAPINEAAWGTAFAVDPGLQTIAAVATGKKRWENRVNVAEAEVRTVTVPPLDADTSAIGAVASDGSKPEAPKDAAPSEQDAKAASSRRTIAYVVGGAGVLFVAVGGYFGVKTISQKSDSDAHCPASGCDAQGVSASDDAHRSAWIADVGVGLGLAALGTSAYLLLTAPSAQPASSARALRVTPIVTADRAALSMTGAF